MEPVQELTDVDLLATTEKAVKTIEADFKQKAIKLSYEGHPTVADLEALWDQ